MTERQIENVARWLFDQVCTIGYDFAKSRSEAKTERQLANDCDVLARALAKALELPKADHCKMLESEDESREWYEIIPSNWLAHVAAVQAIIGEEK